MTFACGPATRPRRMLRRSSSVKTGTSISTASLYKTLVDLQPDYQLPDEFGMFSPEGNKKVKAILAKFFANPDVAEAKKLPTPKERLDAFQDIEVESSEGNTYDEYFGYNDSFE